MTGNDLTRQYLSELLVLLSRVTFKDSERKSAEVLCAKIIDWPLFANLAIKNGLAALIRQNLVDLGLTRHLPDTESKILENLWLKTLARVSYLNSIASEITEILEKEGIRALLLKGLAFEHTLYGSRGLRQMSDADILIHPSEVLTAREILESAGFTSRPLKSCFYRKILLETGNHLPEMDRGGVSVDLHHRLFSLQDEILTEEAFKKPYEFNNGGKLCYTIPPLTAFLALVKHLHKHEIKGEFQLRLYCDLYLLLQRHSEEILCHELMRHATNAGIERKTAEVLFLMKEVYKVNVPEELLPGMESCTGLAEIFYSRLLNPVQTSPHDTKQTYIETFKSVRGIKKRLIFIIGDLFPSFSFMKRRYACNRSIGCIPYYLLRSGKLIWAAEAWIRK